MVRTIAFVLTACVARIGVAALPPGLTPAEAACERIFGPATDRFGAAIATCVVRCDAKAARGRLAETDCAPPYGTATRACIERARSAGVRRIDRGCANDCPECYAGGDCVAFARDALAVTGQVVDGFVRQVLCDDSASADGLSRPEDRCRRVVGSALAKAARALGKCFVRCRQRQERQDLANGPLGGTCTSAPQDRTVARCLSGVRRTALRATHRGCADAPDCLDPATLLDAVAEQIRSDYAVLIFCASPSGAFVDRD